MLNEIRLKEICKQFGDQQVLDHVNLVLPPGSVTCIQGPSGQGKTTLLRILAGLIPADSGELEGVPEKKAFVFQEDRLSEDYSVLGNIRMVTGRKSSPAVIQAHLDQLEIGECLHKKVRELSGGMKRRVSIARAFCYDADLILMDEPFKGLDLKLKEKVMDYVIRQSQGKTLVCVTHDVTEAEYLKGTILQLR